LLQDANFLNVYEIIFELPVLGSEAYLENVVPSLCRGVALLPLPCKVSQLDGETYLENVVPAFCHGVALLPLPCKVSQLDSATYLENVVPSLCRGVAPQGDDSSPPPLCGLIFFEGDRCLCLTLKFVERLKCYSAKPNEFCIIFGIYYFISCLISIVILSLCIFLFLLSFLVRYRVKTMQEKEKMCQTVA
jgi:hypothetical protein